MAIELYNDGTHKCIAFADLIPGQGVQSNQFLIINDNQSMVLDPGGQLSFSALTMSLREYVDPKQLSYLFASHQDPDIIASLESWAVRTEAKIVCSSLWVRFLPHLIPNYMGDKLGDRFISIPDAGMNIVFGNSILKAIPAHFLHSVGNFQMYDPTSKILFSGDMGASIVDEGPENPVEDFAAHIPSMEGFHKRYMVNNKVCQLWVNMVRQLDVDMIVPQHGRPFKGREMIEQFLKWIAKLQCGTDLMTEDNYKIP